MSKIYDVLTYKIPIIRPVSTDWETFNKLAGHFVNTAIKIKNDAITMHYEK